MKQKLRSVNQNLIHEQASGDIKEISEKYREGELDEEKLKTALIELIQKYRINNHSLDKIRQLNAMQSKEECVIMLLLGSYVDKNSGDGEEENKEEEAGTEETTASEAENEPEADDESEQPTLPLPSYITSFKEMSDLDDRIKEWKKKSKILDTVLKTGDYIKYLIENIKKILKILVKIIRFVTFADALDRAVKWLKENHSGTKGIINMAAFLDAIYRILFYVLLTIYFITRPDKAIKKIIPPDIEETAQTFE